MTVAPRAVARDLAVIALILVALLAVVVWWVAVDRRPPEWDHANHLERAILCGRDLARGDLEGVLDRSAFYPPVVPCAAGLVYRVIGADALAGQLTVAAFLGLGLVATYAVARRLAALAPGVVRSKRPASPRATAARPVGESAAGVVAALVFATAPFVVFSALRFQLDLPLAAAVAVALWALLENERFSRRACSILTGVALGLGMLIKPPFAVYLGPPLLLVLARVRGRASWVNAAAAITIAAALCLPWYGPRLVGMPLQIDARSFAQAAESGHPNPFSWIGLTFYPRWILPQLGVVALLLALVGLVIAVRRRHGVLLVALIVPLVTITLIQNKNLRYSLPLIPVAAVLAGLGFAALGGRVQRVVAVVVALAAVVQVTATAVGFPPSRYLTAIDAPWLLPSPPRREEWPHRQILELIGRHAAARAGGTTGRPIGVHGARVENAAPPSVSVVPNAEFFSVSNFRYYAVRDGVDLRFVRAWEDPPLGIDYMIVKTGDQGPSWTAARPRRIAQRLATDQSLARVFPSIGEFSLPDGSRATVRARDIAPGAAPARDVASAIEQALHAELPAVARDVEGLDIRLEWDDGIQVGRVRRLVVTAARATVGELRKRNASLLRLRDLQFVAHDVVVNPHSVLATGRLDLLDVGGLALERVTVAATDLDTFVRGLRRFRGASLALEPGGVRFGLVGHGPPIRARFVIVPAVDRPFAIEVDELRYAGVPVPAFLVNWIVRHYDPTPRMAARLPFPVRIGQVTIVEDAIRVRSTAGEARGR